MPSVPTILNLEGVGDLVQPYFESQFLLFARIAKDQTISTEKTRHPNVERKFRDFMVLSFNW